MELRTLQLFVRSVRDGSFSAAGRHEGLSAASVSRHMKALEDDLGVRLLFRSSRKLSLTEAGELFYQRLEQILGDLQEASDAAANLYAGARGTLRVHSRISVGELCIAPALPAFLAAHPELRVELSLTNETSIDMVAGKVDIDVRIGKLEESSLIARRLTKSERLICASPAYLARHTHPVVPADVAAHNCITYQVHQGQAVWRFLDAGGALSEVPVRGTLRSDNTTVIRSALLGGVGLALMPDWTVAQDLQAGRLVRVLADHRATLSEFENGIYAVYHRNRQTSAKVRVFVDFLLGLFRAPRGPGA